MDVQKYMKPGEKLEGLLGRCIDVRLDVSARGW